MENEIKVGEFIRTNRGHIGKLKRIELDKNDKGLKWYVFDYKEFEINIIKEEYINKPYIVKHSPNLKDVIQKDDFVNKCRVYEIEEKGITVYQTVENSATDYNWISFDEIEEIVTKEMMESVSYKVTKM